MMRTLKTVLAALLVSATAATGAFADDGLQRFEREVKPQLEVQKLSYRDAEALGDQGFVLKDVVAVLPPTPQTDNKPSTIKIDKVTVEAIDFDRLTKGNTGELLPRFAKLKLEGLTSDEAIARSAANYGLPNAPIDVVLDYRLDVPAKRLTLNSFEVSARKQGHVTLALVMDGVDDKASAMEDARDKGRLHSASLTIDDSGLFAQMLQAMAESQGNTPDSLVALGLMTLQALAGPQDDQSMKAFDAVASFLGDWRRPKGPITFTLKPANDASLTDMSVLLAPNALRTVLGLDVSYPGTRPGAATAGVNEK
jgi:hypothetical protein